MCSFSFLLFALVLPLIAIILHIIITQGPFVTLLVVVSMVASIWCIIDGHYDANGRALVYSV